MSKVTSLSRCVSLIGSIANISKSEGEKSLPYLGLKRSMCSAKRAGVSTGRLWLSHTSSSEIFASVRGDLASSWSPNFCNNDDIVGDTNANQFITNFKPGGELGPWRMGAGGSGQEGVAPDFGMQGLSRLLR